VQHPRDLVGRDLHPGQPVDVVDDANPFQVGMGPSRGDRVGGHLGEADRAAVELERAAVDTGELEQVVHQSGEPLGVAPDLGVVALHRLRLGHHPVVERLGHRPDGRQRAAQVVGDPGDELAAGGLQRPLAPPRLLQAGRHLVQLGGELAHLPRP
jgi:hypothetical protein